MAVGHLSGVQERPQRKANRMAFAVAVDVGGTFTDLVGSDVASQVVYTKSPTTYGNFVDGMLDCFGKARMTPREADLVNHGTTLVINSLVQRRGARTALVTTAGSATCWRSRAATGPIRSISLSSATSR